MRKKSCKSCKPHKQKKNRRSKKCNKFGSNYQKDVNNLVGAMGPMSDAFWKNTNSTTGDPWSLKAAPLYYSPSDGYYVTSYDSNAAPSDFNVLDSVRGSWNPSTAFGRKRKGKGKGKKKYIKKKCKCPFSFGSTPCQSCGLRNSFGSCQACGQTVATPYSFNSFGIK